MFLYIYIKGEFKMHMSVLMEKMRDERKPIHAILKLTYQCNFRCVHCYQTPEKGISPKQELNTKDWFKIIDMLKIQGILTITFTGGEVLARSDFWRIYLYAYEKNFKITILSNISMLCSEMIDFLKDHPPMCISLTLYGFSENSYYRFTRSANAFSKVMQSIHTLIKQHIRIKVKVIANTINQHELDQMYIFFQKYKISYFFYYNIINYNDGSRASKRYQLPLIDCQFKFGDIQMLSDKIQNGSCLLGEKCAAGLNSFSIDPYGNMYLCELCDGNKYNVLKLGFERCWEKMFEERGKNIDIETVCDRCCYRKFCSSCNPKLKYENGNSGKPSNRDCYRAHILKRMVEGPWKPNSEI